jgi:hypothetical protein
MTPVGLSQHQADAVYIDLSNAFDHIPHNLFCFGFFDGYVSWFRSYLTNRQSQVRISGTLSLPFQVVSSVPKGLVLGPFLFNIFINDVCNSINRYKFLIFANDAQNFLHHQLSTLTPI